MRKENKECIKKSMRVRTKCDFSILYISNRISEFKSVKTDSA